MRHICLIVAAAFVFASAGAASGLSASRPPIMRRKPRRSVRMEVRVVREPPRGLPRASVGTSLAPPRFSLTRRQRA